MSTIRDAQEVRGVKPRRQKPSIGLIITLVALAVGGYLFGTYQYTIGSAVAGVFGERGVGGSLDLSSLQDTYRAVTANYDGDIDEAKLIEGAQKGMVDALGDDYTVFMNQTEAKAFDDSLNGSIGGGVGIEVGSRDGRLTVIRLLRDNPAEKAGVLAGDIIVKVNDEDVTALSVEQTVAKIRGEAGTTVKLDVVRGSERKDFTLTRAIVNNPSVYSSVQDGVGVITITRFDDQTGSLARVAAQDLKAQNVRGVVLDLRGNGGGYVTAAQQVASLWLDNKIVVSERTNGKVIDELRTGSNPILGGIPTVVLVNESSASASEIVAGALRDHGAAKLVGTKTFGKGSVQKIVTLPAGAELKVTIARWYTPNGENISKEGLKPDIEAVVNQADIGTGKDTQLDAARQSLQ